jgi:transposase
LLVKQRTQLVNMIRGLLAEFGIDIPKGLERALLMARRIVDGEAPDVPMEAAKIIGTLSRQALDIHIRLREVDRDLLVWQRGNDVAPRLMTIPGIGPAGATALAASITDPRQFRSGRQFAAWLGLTPLGGLQYDICVLTGDYRGKTYGPFEKSLEIIDELQVQ